ncbi:MAG: hypothetical protein M3159_09210 [Actinomycetota bacterium]|nr:hypothetical protein [Actinomycetota bacterium]
MCEDRRVIEEDAEAVGDERYAGIAAAAIAVAMVCLLVGALIGALAIDLGSGPDVWKARVRLMSVSRSGLFGGVLIALGLLVALSLARRAARVAPVLTAVVAASVWLGLLMVLNIYVDITTITPSDVAFATVLGDLAALVMLAVAGVWGFSLAGAKRR